MTTETDAQRARRRESWREYDRRRNASLPVEERRRRWRERARQHRERQKLATAMPASLAPPARNTAPLPSEADAAFASDLDQISNADPKSLQPDRPTDLSDDELDAILGELD